MIRKKTNNSGQEDVIFVLKDGKRRNVAER